MTETRPELEAGGPPSEADQRMAELLAGDRRAQRRARESLQHDQTDSAADLRRRLHAIDFLDELVNDQTDLPEQISEYRITGLLGRGGMGTVYEAWHETLERDVALKVLSPALSADTGMRRRFRSEARANAALHHPNIVPIYDYGEAGGLLFFAMERVQGISLDKHIAGARRRKQPLYEPREAARRFAGVADALAHAHSRKILHRDIKPGNLLVDPAGNLALADFGLSKSLGEQRGSLALTSAGGFLGTLAYASPEQALGRGVGPASDLYSLGVTMFEVLTGELPLPTADSDSVLQVLLESRPRRLRELLPKAPRDLELLLNRCLEKDPADRYPDGETLARDLQRIADGEPIRMRRQSVFTRVMRAARKNPGTTAAILLSLLLLLVSFGMWTRNRDNRLRLLQANHQSLLQGAVAAAQGDPGSAAGPPGLLDALLGLPLEHAPGAVRAFALLAQAEALQVDGDAVEQLRFALADDPAPGIAPMLAAGNGYGARNELTRLIDANAPRFRAGDEPTILRVYSLYLMRAVASLTAAVAEPDAARDDLIRATMTRSGAWLPQLLLALLDWEAPQGVAALRTRLEGLLAEAPEGGAQLTGLLLGAFCNHHRAPTSHLMSFELPFGACRELAALARELAPQSLPASVAYGDLAYSGLERQLATAARTAMAARGDLPAQRAASDAALRLLDERVAPRSPLQSWRYVFALLQEPPPPPAFGDGSEMPVELQIAAWIRLLELKPKADYVQALKPRSDQLLEQIPDGPSGAQLRTLLAERSGDEEALLNAAQSWHWLAVDDPGPLLARFRAHALAGRDTEAAAAAVQAIQLTGDRVALAPRIAGILDELELGKPGGEERWCRLRTMLCGSE